MNINDLSPVEKSENVRCESRYSMPVDDDDIEAEELNNYEAEAPVVESKEELNPPEYL